MKKKNRTPTPHDAAFRQFLAQPEIARDFLQAGESSDAKAFVRELAQRMPQQGDELMTIAEQLKQEGLEKGIEQGIQPGRQEGRNEGKLEVARRLLEMGMPSESVQEATGLSEAELAQIRH